MNVVFYGLLLKGSVTPSGRFFAFVKPLAIADQDFARAYVFPFLNIAQTRHTLENLDLFINAMAEMNATNSSEQLIRLGGLSRMNPNLVDSSPQQVTINSLFKEKGKEHSALRRHEEVLARWKSVVRNFRSLKTSLCSNDLHFTNASYIDGKFLFLDMGSAKISPLGAETFWLLTDRTKIVKNEVILLKYISALKSFGIQVSLEEVQLAAYASIAKKWLNVHATIPSTLRAENYLYALSCAEFCLKICEA